MGTKNFVAVICEYNPFHFGHRFQMDRLKERFDGVVCIMSGDIVQRGSVAVADKYLRAETALKNGADLVLELPIPYCCSSARDFARAGVFIADAIGVGSLAFGAEDDENTLFAIQKYVESVDFSQKTKDFVEKHKNVSYPQAVTEIIKDALGENACEAIKKPNNILSLEYLSAINGTGLEPFIIKREKGLLSSTEIRNSDSGDEMLSLLPEESRTVLGRELDKRFPRDTEKLDSFFIGTLRMMSATAQIPKNLYSTPYDLAQKIINGSVKCSSVSDLVALCTDKNYTSARIRRSINAIVFGIEQAQLQEDPSYTTVLALNDIGRGILRNAKKKGRIDIITKPVDALERGEKTKKAYLFSKSVEDVISLSEPIPSPADEGRNPMIGAKK